MSIDTRNDDASDLQEEEEVVMVEEEIKRMAETIREYRTNLPDQLNSTLSSLLTSQRPPILPPHLADQPETRPDSEAGVTQGPFREHMALSVTQEPEEAEKMQLLKQKILSSASNLPVVLNRMKEYMARIDKIESLIGKNPVD